MKIFVPWSEDLVEKHPDLLTRLVPYQPGMLCAHQADPRETDDKQAPTSPEENLQSKTAA